MITAGSFAEQCPPTGSERSFVMDKRLKGLIAVGASIAVNCQPWLKRSISQAKVSGASNYDITKAIEVGMTIRAGAVQDPQRLARRKSDVNYASARLSPGGC